MFMFSQQVKYLVLFRLSVLAVNFLGTEKHDNGVSKNVSF